MSEWKNINKEIPRYHQKVLFIVKNEIISGRYTYDDNEKGCFDDILFNECFYQEDVSYWMPSPPLPELRE